MKERLLKYLACPVCHASLSLAGDLQREGQEIMAGRLECNGCQTSYPIDHGVPHFADLDHVGEEKAATAAGFGWEWKKFTQHDEKYREQFLGWLKPVSPGFFKDKVVLDGGCG